MKRLSTITLGILFALVPLGVQAQTTAVDAFLVGGHDSTTELIWEDGTMESIGWEKSGPGDGLYLRLIGDVDLGLGKDLAVHEFSGEFYFYARGTETLAEITAMFDLQGDDLIDLAEIKGKFDAKGAPFGRYEYGSDLEHGLELAEGRRWDRVKFNNEMELTW